MVEATSSSPEGPGPPTADVVAAAEVCYGPAPPDGQQPHGPRQEPAHLGVALLDILRREQVPADPAARVEESAEEVVDGVVAAQIFEGFLRPTLASLAGDVGLEKRQSTDDSSWADTN